MTINTTLAGLSQTASLNGPDGASDLPSQYDDAIRYHGAFIAQLRDGVGYAAGAVVAALGFTPVRQGGGTNQGTNIVRIGWGTGAYAGRLALQVDASDMGFSWPIDITGTAAAATTSAACSGNAATASNASLVNGQQFSYSNSFGNAPTFLWASNSSGFNFLVQPTLMTVGGSNAVNGISGWTYTNSGANPAYIWCTDGGTNYQHLTTPAALSVGFASSAGTSSSCSGNAATASNAFACSGNAANAFACSGNSATASLASNSNALGGTGAGNFLQNSGSALNSIRNNGLAQLIGNISGSGDTFWGTTFISDRRVKMDIAPTTQDSLAKFAALDYVSYRIDPTKRPGADDKLHKVGFIAQEAKVVDDAWVHDDPALSEYMHVNDQEIMLSVMHALKQAHDKIVALEARVAALGG